MTIERVDRERQLPGELVPLTTGQTERYSERLRHDFPGSLRQYLLDPERHTWQPGVYEAIVAEQQLRAIGSKEEAELLHEASDAIARTLDGGRWERIRHSVAGGNPVTAELQLVLFSAIGEPLHFNRGGRAWRFMNERYD